MQSRKFKTVPEYIGAAPAAARPLLRELRNIVRKISPVADEAISYNIPGYKLHGMLVYFAGYKNHVGLYPGASGVRVFKEALSSYKTAKGSIQFPLDKPLPGGLIKKIVRYKVKENMAKARMKELLKRKAK